MSVCKPAENSRSREQVHECSPWLELWPLLNILHSSVVERLSWSEIINKLVSIAIPQASQLLDLKCFSLSLKSSICYRIYIWYLMKTNRQLVIHNNPLHHLQSTCFTSFGHTACCFITPIILLSFGPPGCKPAWWEILRKRKSWLCWSDSSRRRAGVEVFMAEAKKLHGSHIFLLLITWNPS